MRYYFVYHAHLVGFLSRILSAKEEDFTRSFLTYLASEVGRAKPSVETCNIRIGLLEDGVLFRSNSHITHYMKTVATTYCPTRHNSDHDLIHESDLTLYI